jgi:hypothetical protein
MWNFKDMTTKKVYEYPAGCLSKLDAQKTLIGTLEAGNTIGGGMKLVYDYGSTEILTLKLKSIKQAKDVTAEEKQAWPR